MSFSPEDQMQKIDKQLERLGETITAILKTYPDSPKVEAAAGLFEDISYFTDQIYSTESAFAKYHYIQCSRFFGSRLLQNLEDVFRQQDVGAKYLSQSYLEQISNEWLNIRKTDIDTYWLVLAEFFKLQAAKQEDFPDADDILKYSGSIDIVIHAYYAGSAAASGLIHELQTEIGHKQVLRKSPVNPGLSKGPLVPIVAPSPISSIVARVWPNAKITSKAQLVKQCKLKKLNLYIWDHQTPHQTRYDISQVTDAQKTQQYEQRYGKQSGVNLAMIERSKTVEQNYSSSRRWKVDTSTEPGAVWHKSHVNALVLESLDSDLYWILSNNFYDPVVPQSVIDQIIPDIQLREISSQYSEHQILRHMFLEVKPDLKKIEHRSNANIEVDIIRNDLYFATHNMLTKHLKKLAKSKNVKEDLGQLIHSGEIGSIFEGIINKNLAKYLAQIKSIYTQEAFPIAEMLLTFDNSLYMYKRDLRKKVHDDYTQLIAGELNEETIGEFMVKLSKDVSELISNETNIFQATILKLMLHKRLIFDN
jgi:hypothetical protein